VSDHSRKTDTDVINSGGFGVAWVDHETFAIIYDSDAAMCDVTDIRLDIAGRALRGHFTKEDVDIVRWVAHYSGNGTPGWAAERADRLHEIADKLAALIAATEPS
jgi:hypothetical protein